jgi:hypothetical protein
MPATGPVPTIEPGVATGPVDEETVVEASAVVVADGASVTEVERISVVVVASVEPDAEVSVDSRLTVSVVERPSVSVRVVEAEVADDSMLKTASE